MHRFICDYLQERSTRNLLVCHIAQTKPHTRLSHPEVSTRLSEPSSKRRVTFHLSFLPLSSPPESQKFDRRNPIQLSSSFIKDLDLSHPSARTPLCENRTLLFQPRIGPVSVFHPSSTIEGVSSPPFSLFFFFLISILSVALDTTSPLPLFNSLHHLTYLTSTSPRIREIMTMDGGLERLVRILHDFCMCPPPPENPNVIYGLSPPNTRPPKLVPTLNPPTFDKHAAYRFSLAFQCVVNIGVRGSEPIRSRVVQAGTLDVVGCILEAWLANKGFAVGPSSSATGLPRESREQRLARRQALAEQRQRDGAAELTRALQRQIAAAESFRQEHINTEANGNVDEVDRVLCPR